MKRMLMVLTAALIMAAMAVAMAAPAFAAPDCTGPPGERPGACKITDKGQGKEPGPPGPGEFVGPGGGP